MLDDLCWMALCWTDGLPGICARALCDGTRPAFGLRFTLGFAALDLLFVLLDLRCGLALSNFAALGFHVFAAPVATRPTRVEKQFLQRMAQPPDRRGQRQLSFDGGDSLHKIVKTGRAAAHAPELYDLRAAARPVRDGAPDLRARARDGRFFHHLAARQAMVRSVRLSLPRGGTRRSSLLRCTMAISGRLARTMRPRVNRFCRPKLCRPRQSSTANMRRCTRRNRRFARQ